MDVIVFYVLVPLIKLAAIMACISIPLALVVLISYVSQKLGMQKSYAKIISGIVISGFILWPVSGFFQLKNLCDNQERTHFLQKKIGPVNTIFFEGYGGMGWLNKKVNSEFAVYGRSNEFTRIYVDGVKNRNNIASMSKSKLLSFYKVSVNAPEVSSFTGRYLSIATIDISERLTERIIYQAKEYTWGGGILGYYIALFHGKSPIKTIYLSCGYAGDGVGIFRGISSERKKQYYTADKALAGKVFIIKIKK